MEAELSFYMTSLLQIKADMCENKNLVGTILTFVKHGHFRMLLVVPRVCFLSFSQFFIKPAKLSVEKPVKNFLIFNNSKEFIIFFISY